MKQGLENNTLCDRMVTTRAGKRSSETRQGHHPLYLTEMVGDVKSSVVVPGVLVIDYLNS